MSVKYSWSRQNGAAVPPVRFMSIEPAEDYYKGMPLKLKENGIVEPTDGDPEYICMAQYDPDAEIQPLEIPVQEVFPDVIYEKINNDGTTEEVRFGSRGGGGGIKTVNGQKPDANGNVEVTAGVQSDMYETDPESMAFVKNNPLETVPDEVPLEITFDGNLEGKETVHPDGAPWSFVKIYDSYINMESMIGSEVVFVENGVDSKSVVTADDVVDGSMMGMPGYICMGFYVVEESFSMDGLSLTPGIWIQFVDKSNYLSAISNPNVLIPGSERTQLKPSLLPYGEIIEKVLEAIPTAKGVSF